MAIYSAERQSLVPTSAGKKTEKQGLAPSGSGPHPGSDNYPREKDGRCIRQRIHEKVGRTPQIARNHAKRNIDTTKGGELATQDPNQE